MAPAQGVPRKGGPHPPAASQGSHGTPKLSRGKHSLTALPTPQRGKGGGGGMAPPQGVSRRPWQVGGGGRVARAALGRARLAAIVPDSSYRVTLAHVA